MIGRAGALLACGLLLCALGCAQRNTAYFTLKSNEGKVFSQRFTEAVAAQGGDAIWRVILLADPTRTKPRQGASGAISPAADEPLRQIVSVRVLWLPMRGNIRLASVANASVEWIITGLGSDTERRLSYGGAGHVLASGGGESVRVTIESASLAPLSAKGLRDPIGEFSLSGSINARVDPERYNALAGQLAR